MSRDFDAAGTFIDHVHMHNPRPFANVLVERLCTQWTRIDPDLELRMKAPIRTHLVGGRSSASPSRSCCCGSRSPRSATCRSSTKASEPRQEGPRRRFRARPASPGDAPNGARDRNRLHREPDRPPDRRRGPPYRNADPQAIPFLVEPCPVDVTARGASPADVRRPMPAPGGSTSRAAGRGSRGRRPRSRGSSVSSKPPVVVAGTPGRTQPCHR